MAEQRPLNGWAVKFLVGALWTVVFTSLTIIGTNVIANDKESRARDDRIKTSIQQELKEVKTQQTALIAQQAAMSARQENVIDILKEIKQEIKAH